MMYLVTGGAGFIGSNIVSKLLNEGFKVRVIDNFSTGKRENIKIFVNDIELIEGDIRSLGTVEKAVKGVDYILHQAALPSVPRSISDPITTHEINTNGTLNLLDAATKNNIKRFVMASSSSIYGDIPELPKNENMTPNPLSPYAVSKLAGEHYCMVFNKLYNLPTVCLRYFNVFGPNQDPDSQYSAVIPKFIKAIMNNKSPVIYGDGSTSRDFTFVDNVVNANISACKYEQCIGNIINIATNTGITLNNLVEKINRILKKEIPAIFESDKKGDIKHSLASIEKAKELIKYEPSVYFDEGLSRTVDTFRKLEN